MAAPVDSKWAGNPCDDPNLNKTTYGQKTSFPSSWPTDRLFWRSDFKRLYYNRGTEGSPDWEGADVPVGSVQMYAGAIADIPPGWLLCDGAAVSRTTYSRLFDVLDTEYGTGDGSTTFNVPDFKTSNIFPRGATDDAGRGGTGGESTHVLTETEMPSHTHVDDAGLLVNSTSGATPRGTVLDNGGRSRATSSTGGDTAHENKPPFLDIHFIIAV